MMGSGMAPRPGSEASKVAPGANWNMLGGGWDPINLNLLQTTERRGQAPGSEWTTGAVQPAAPQMAKELFLSDIENFFTDDVASALQVAADDALNSNATQLQLSVVDLSPFEGLGTMGPGAVWRPQEAANPSTNINLMDQLNRTLLEGLQQTLQTTAGRTPAKTTTPETSTGSKTKGTTVGAAKKSTKAAPKGAKGAQAQSQAQPKPPLAKEKPSRVTHEIERTLPAKRDSRGKTVSTSEDADSLGDSNSDESEESKKMSKREKNILACRKARRKRREKMATMEERLRELEAKNSALETRLRVTSLPTDNLPADIVEKQEFDSVKEDRIAVITGLYRAMNDGKLEREQHNFHPNCVMVKPMEELIGAQSMWRSWSALRQRFASMHWEILKIDPLDLRGDQIRTEWVFHGLLKGDVTTVDELARVKREDLKRVFEMEDGDSPSSPFFVAPPKSPKSGSRLTAIEFQGRSYYIFTADNRLVFVNHNFVRPPVFRRMGGPDGAPAARLLEAEGSELTTSIVPR